jgi:hypothetical protein
MAIQCWEWENLSTIPYIYPTYKLRFSFLKLSFPSADTRIPYNALQLQFLIVQFSICMIYLKINMLFVLGREDTDLELWSQELCESHFYYLALKLSEGLCVGVM